MKPYKTMTLRLNATEYAHLCRQAEVTGLKRNRWCGSSSWA